MSNQAFVTLNGSAFSYNEDGSGRMFVTFAYMLMQPDGTAVLPDVLPVSYAPLSYDSTFEELFSAANAAFLETWGPGNGFTSADLEGLTFVYLAPPTRLL